MHNGILQFKKEAKGIKVLFPELNYSEIDDGFPVIAGDLILKDQNEEVIDGYKILIKPTVEYPFRFPHVFETEGRLPNNIDWHVFNDGHCCIKSIPEEIIICRKGINLHSFIRDQVIPYFFNQKYRELNGYFLKERSHGVEGWIEYFEEIFNTKNLEIIYKGLLFLLERNEPNRVSKCFCGSGLKYRKCHRTAFRLLSLFKNEELTRYTKMIIENLRKREVFDI